MGGEDPFQHRQGDRRLWDVREKSVLYYRFSAIYNSQRGDILKKPDLFTESLRAFFGERAFHVEDAIVGSVIDTFHLSDVTYSDSWFV